MLRPICVFILSLSFWGCTDPIPEFSNSDQIEIPQPTFNGKTTATVSMASPFVEIPINGECDIRTRALEVMVEGQTSWTTLDAVSEGQPFVNCDAQTFSLRLPSLKTMNKFDLSQDVSFNVEFKSLTVAGYSKSSILTVKYDPSIKVGNPPNFAINPGGGFNESVSTNHKLKSQISFKSSHETSSPSFKIQSGIRVQ